MEHMRRPSKRVTFEGHGGCTLAARLDLPAAPPKAYAIFAHCFTCSKDLFAAGRIAAELNGQGIAVLRFDFTGLGSSEGDFGNTNFSSNVEDLVRAAAWLRAEHAAPQLLVGHSLGGAAVLAAAREIPEVVAVATIGAPADTEHLAELFVDDLGTIERDGEATVQLAGRTFTIRRQLLDDLAEHEIVACAAGLDAALLVLHSPIDNTVGIEHAARIYQAAKHPKSFVSLDDADHLLSRHVDAEFAARMIGAWAERYLVEQQPRHPAPPPPTQWSSPRPVRASSSTTWSRAATSSSRTSPSRSAGSTPVRRRTTCSRRRSAHARR
jgi:alpha/beta superfamily hydrolase